MSLVVRWLPFPLPKASFLVTWHIVSARLHTCVFRHRLMSSSQWLNLIGENKKEKREWFYCIDKSWRKVYCGKGAFFPLMSILSIIIVYYFHHQVSLAYNSLFISLLHSLTYFFMFPWWILFQQLHNIL